MSARLAKKTSARQAKRPQAEFVRVAECLYRNKSSDTYYALIKHQGTQIRKSLGTKNRKRADKELALVKDAVARLSSDKAMRKLTFAELGDLWLPFAGSGNRESSNKQL